MKKLLLLVGMLAMPSFAAVSANVAFTTDYVWRGMTQSDGPVSYTHLTLPTKRIV